MFFQNLLYILVVLLVTTNKCHCEDFYQMFGIPKDASDRDIRKAFKKLAVTLHPDKNLDDPDADSKFVKITRAYEVLKDTESRKQYDLYGEEGIKGSNGQQNYQSWSYYHDQFGIYDDDPEIVTLNQADFENSVLRSTSLWFINFYSTSCSHCHVLAPTWRRLAWALKGVIRIGAVNCEEEYLLCRQENVRSYPSVIIYPKREKFQGDRNQEDLMNFVLNRIQAEVKRLTTDTWLDDRPWVIFLCEGVCYEDNTRLLVAAMLANLVDVAQVECDLQPALCDKLLPGITGGIIFYRPGRDSEEIRDEGATEIANKVLEMLPEALTLDQDTFDDLLTRLQLGATTSWLVHFDIGATTEEDLEWRRLPALAPSLNLARVHCGRWVNICSRLHIKKYPTFVVFKVGGGYEIHHGRSAVYDVADFARDASQAQHVRSLTPLDFSEILQDSSNPWLIDFYAPWCPPCLRLLPEIRSTSRAMNGAIMFGTVDCTEHDALCRQQQVNSYPTSVLFNNTQNRIVYFGNNKAKDLQDFLDDFLKPVVTKLTEVNFREIVGKKEADHMWLVDFYAPWCGPCQQLKPEWRKLAKMVSSLSYVSLGEVDCEREKEFCDFQNVRGYPTIRLYPLGGIGTNTVAVFSGYQRDAHSLRKWLFNFLPSRVEELHPDTFEAKVRHGNEPWLVDFYAPWCGHCVVFEPEFQTLAERLDKKVLCGKLNCERYRTACQQAGVTGYPTLQLYNTATSFHGKPVEIKSQIAEEIYKQVVQRLLQRDSNNNVHDEF